MCTRGRKRSSRGLSLIELVLFIIIVGVSIAGVLLAIDRTARASADPLVIKQALAVAEALLEEVELMPFTFCDPDDAQASTAQSATVGAAGCATLIEGIGREAGETRYSASTPFDNVNDYNGYDSATEGGIRDVTSTLITELASYRATVSIAPAALGGIAATDANGQANVLLITVTVTGPPNITVVLNGYRTKYAPRI
jgi:MSHA pilin protein MshD